MPHSVCSRSCKLLVRKLHSDKQRSVGWCTNWTTCLRWRAIRKFMEWTGYHLVAQSCLTLRDRVDCSPPGFSVYGVSQATILEWAAISTSRGSSRPGVSCLGRLILCSWTTGETLKEWMPVYKRERTAHTGPSKSDWPDLVSWWKGGTAARGGTPPHQLKRGWGCWAGVGDTSPGPIDYKPKCYTDMESLKIE